MIAGSDVHVRFLHIKLQFIDKNLDSKTGFKYEIQAKLQPVTLTRR